LATAAARLAQVTALAAGAAEEVSAGCPFATGAADEPAFLEAAGAAAAAGPVAALPSLPSSPAFFLLFFFFFAAAASGPACWRTRRLSA